MLGPLRVRSGERLLWLGSRKQRMLLACLLLNPNQLVQRDQLVETLWRDNPPPSAELTLRSLVSRLRAALDRDSEAGAGCYGVHGRDGGYLLDIDSQLIDSSRFEQFLATGRAALAVGRAAAATEVLGAGLSLWRGRPFPDLTEHPPAEAAVAHLEQLRAAAVEDLAEAQLAADRPDDALLTLEPHLAAYPLRERGWGQLMRALYRVGRQVDALAAYRELRERLRDELGVEPDPGLRHLEQRILRHHPDLDPRSAAPARAGSHPGAAAPTPPARVPAARLPTAATPLVGRGAELARLDELLGGTRLLTLTGAGGVGKTRLALQLATHTADRFADGARLVELAPVRAEENVVAHAAATVGVASAGTRDPAALRDRLVEFFRDQDVLLVVDNCEHVIVAAATLVEALRNGCPRLRVLATSREPLALPGELVYPVPALSLPPTDVTTPADLEGSDAAALFCQRAATAQVGFGATAENAAAIAAICRRLDGLPLALELAAGKVRALATQRIAERLDDRFHLLTGGARTALPRQQTLRATMDWSFGLLSAAERRLLARLSVFPATFDLPAAEFVGGSEEPGDAATVAELVSRLVDKSLIDVGHRDGRVRYRLLETVRAYCAEQLARSGEGDEARRRHREHYVRLIAAQRPGRPSRPFTSSWLWQVKVDEDNFRASTQHALEENAHAEALVLLGGLWLYWMWAGRAEAPRWLERALAGAGGETAERVDATVALAAMYTWWESGSPGRSEALFSRARRMADDLRDAGCRWRARYFHAEFLQQRCGDLAVATAEYHAAARVAPDPGAIGCCDCSLGWVALSQGDLAGARAWFQAAVEHGADTDLVLTHALAALAPLQAMTGEAEQARDLAERAVTVAERFPLPTEASVMALLRAAQTHLLRHDTEAARRRLGELFDLMHRLGGRRFGAESFEAAAVLAARTGDFVSAAHYLGVRAGIQAQRAADNVRISVLDSLVETCRAQTLARLGTAGYRAAEQAGRQLSPTEALARARAAW